VGDLYFILLLQLLYVTYIQRVLQLVFWFTLSTARRMVGIITLTVLGAGLTLLKLGIDLRRNIEKAKRTGLPYIVGREFDLTSLRYNHLLFIIAIYCNHDNEMANMVRSTVADGERYLRSVFASARTEELSSPVPLIRH